MPSAGEAQEAIDRAPTPRGMDSAPEPLEDSCPLADGSGADPHRRAAAGAVTP